MSFDPMIPLFTGTIPASEKESRLKRRAMIWKGATEAYWCVSSKERARKCDHAYRANQKFELAKGLEEADGQRVFPGEEKYCYCRSAPIFPAEILGDSLRARPRWNKFNVIVNLLTVAVGACVFWVMFLVMHFSGK